MKCYNNECASKNAQGILEKNLFNQILFIGALILYIFALLADFKIFGISLSATFVTLLFVICYFSLGYGILKEAFYGVIKKEVFNENTLMALASLSAFCIGESATSFNLGQHYKNTSFFITPD